MAFSFIFSEGAIHCPREAREKKAGRVKNGGLFFGGEFCFPRGH